MKILLVSPIRDPHQFTNKAILIPQLALFILQGLTPKQHEVKIVEEEYMKLDLDEECDVVAISCMTSNIYRGYRIADAVVMKWIWIFSLKAIDTSEFSAALWNKYRMSFSFIETLTTFKFFKIVNEGSKWQKTALKEQRFINRRTLFSPAQARESYPDQI
jgi:hypothetical protein